MATMSNIYSFDVLNQIRNAAIVTLCGANLLKIHSATLNGFNNDIVERVVLGQPVHPSKCLHQQYVSRHSKSNYLWGGWEWDVSVAWQFFTQNS